MINIAIVGYGGMGGFHKDLIINNKNYNLVGVHDIKEERNLLAESQGIKSFKTLEELLNLEELDVVLIVTPNDSHKEIAIKSLNAKKDVICEKPVTITTKEFEDIIESAKKNNKTFAIHQNRRWDEDFLIVKNIIDKEIIGDVFHIESRVYGAAGIPGDWRKIKENGGGMLYDWGIHLFDQLYQLKGSKTKSIFYNPSYILGEPVDDGFTSYFKFDDNTTALIEVQTTNAINLPRWYLKGTEGTAVINDWSNEGEIIVAKNKFLKHGSKPIKAGAGFTKTMAPLADSELERISLPKPLFYEKDFYDHYFETYGTEDFKIKNEEVMEVMKVIEELFKHTEPIII